MSERYLGFYTTRPFWAIKKPAFENVKTPGDFHDFMAEVVFRFENDFLKLKVCCDGMVILQIPELEKRNPMLQEGGRDLADDVTWWGEYLEYLNCLQILLESSVLDVAKIGYLEFTELTRYNSGRIELEDDKFISGGVGMESYSYMYEMARFLHLYTIDPQFDPRNLMRIVFSEDVFRSLSEKMSNVFSDFFLVSQLATLGKSLSEYKTGNYAISLVLAWFVIERLISQQWREYLKISNKEFSQGVKRLNSDRIARLTEGRDYPISVILNFLELANAIPFDDFKEIDKVRDYRNKIVHQNKDFHVTDTHCRDALNIALKLLLDKRNVVITLNFSYRTTGP